MVRGPDPAPVAGPTWHGQGATRAPTDASGALRTRPKPGVSGRALQAGARTPRRPAPAEGRLIAVVVGLVRAGDGHAEVVGLPLAELGELHAELVEVQPGHLLVEVLRQ